MPPYTVAGDAGPATRPATNGRHKPAVEASSKPTPAASQRSSSSSTPPPPPPAGIDAFDLVEERVTFLLDPWIPRGMLTLVTGLPDIGKSTFAAYLMSKAKRTILFPGSEDPLRILLLPRLRAAGVSRGKVQVIEDQDWRFPTRQERLADQVEQLRADLVILDPAGSYLESGVSEDCNQAIRVFLESLAWVAGRTGAAVVAIHHPGKAVGNLVRGAMNWRAVPRGVVHLRADPSDPTRRIIAASKCSFGPPPSPRFYRLDDGPGGGKVFTFDDQVDEDLAAIAEEYPTPAARRKIDEAMDLLRQLLATEEQLKSWCIAQGEKLGISASTMKDARRALKAPTRKEKFGKDAQQFWGPITPT